jgi:uncharacterized protein YkwD
MKRTYIRLYRVAALFAVSLNVGCSSATSPPSGDTALDLAVKVNSFRASVGCSELSWDTRLAAVAAAHSRDMARRSFFHHVNPDGQDPEDRVRSAGIEWDGPVGENLALTTGGPWRVLELWLGSATHRRNLENCAFTHQAVGLFDGYWTHLFLANPVD